MLGATVPASWPPDKMLADALPWFLRQLEEDATRACWLGWYGLAISEGGRPVLVASGGFLGPPKEGTVEIGYSVLPEFRGRRYASEMMAALVGWARSYSGVVRIIAAAKAENTPSVRLLTGLGFAAVGAGAEPGMVRFEIAFDGAGSQ